jgi:hypothetical protein
MTVELSTPFYIILEVRSTTHMSWLNAINIDFFQKPISWQLERKKDSCPKSE